MAETGNTKATVSKFERMSVEELEEAIRILFETDDLDDNMENLLLASEVLDRKKEAMGDRVDTDAQWDRFQRDYLPLLNDEDDEDLEEGKAEKAIAPGAQAIEKGQKILNRKPIAVRAFHAVAAAVLIFMLLGMTACAVIPKVRTAVVNFVINAFGSHSVVSMDAGADQSRSIDTETYELNGYIFEIPSEYEQDYVITEKRHCVCNFIRGECSIVIYVSSSDYSPVQLDTEGTETKSIIINGKEGFVIEKDNQKHITWGDPENNKIICVLGESVPEEILLNIAESFVPLE